MQRVDFLARTDLFGIELSIAHWSGPTPLAWQGVIFEGAQRIQKLNLAPKAQSHCWKQYRWEKSRPFRESKFLVRSSDF
jgi:hypothetical protein